MTKCPVQKQTQLTLQYLCRTRQGQHVLILCAFFAAHTVHTYNINGRDLQRKNVVNNVDKSSLWAP